LPPDLWSNNVKNPCIPCLEPSSGNTLTLAVINKGFFEEYFNKRVYKDVDESKAWK